MKHLAHHAVERLQRLLFLACLFPTLRLLSAALLGGLGANPVA